jgi:hypothetical protein
VKITQVLLNLLLIAAAAAALIGCGGCGTREADPGGRHAQEIQQIRTEGKIKKQEERDKTPKIKPKAPGKYFIKKAFFTPELVKAGTALKITVELTEEPDESDFFSYIYWKNGTQLIESHENTLAPENYKKGDLIYADVLFYRDGELAEKSRSEIVQIVNSSPVIKEVIIPKIEGPGSYTITVKAADIDGDKIKYTLLPVKEGDKLFEGLQINSITGSVTCTLGETPPPEKMRFIIAADDSDGGIAKKVVTITFEITKKEEQTETTEKEEDNQGALLKNRPLDPHKTFYMRTVIVPRLSTSCHIQSTSCNFV